MANLGVHMKALCVMLAAAAAVTSTAAVAQTGPAYALKGECQRALAWAYWENKRGIPNPHGILSPDARCEKIAGLWYIVDGA